MDFSKVKNWDIPEGKVQAVYSNGEIIWNAETTVKVSGTWQFNETPTLVPIEEEVDTLAHWYTGNPYSPFDDCYKIVITDTKILFECVGGDEEHNTIYSTSGGWKDTMARVFSFNGTQVVSKQFYDWLTANAKKVYDEMVACLEGKWKFSPTPDIDNIAPSYKDEVAVFEVGIVDGNGFHARGTASGERFLFGSVKMYWDAWGDFVMSYDGAPASTTSEIKVYYVPSTELVWRSDYWRTMDFGEGTFLDFRLWEWMVGWIGEQNALPTIDEETEPWG